MPLTRASVELEPDSSDAELLADAAPGVNIDDERQEPAIPLLPSRAKPPSARPEESFADIDAELFDRAPPAPLSEAARPPASDRAPAAPLSDRAPPAPLTARRMSEPARDGGDATPPRAIPFSSLTRDADDEPEATIVGKVPSNLLELSGAGNDQTRAFTAPRELIELARRKREERERSSKTAANERATERPPAATHPDAAAPVEGDDADFHAPAVQADSAPPRAIEDDAAPPVARAVSGGMEAAAPPRHELESGEPPSDLDEVSGPIIEIGPASDMSMLGRDSLESPLPSSDPGSEPLPSAGRSAVSRLWIWLALLFVIVGITIARWRDIAQLFR